MTAERSTPASGARPDAVLFLETRGSGLSSNLVAVRNALLSERPDLELRYLVFKPAKTWVGRALQRQTVRVACRGAAWVVSSSDSLPPTMPAIAVGKKRILIQPVRQHMLGGEPVAFDWSRYTDVVAQSAFVGAAVQREVDASPSVRVHATGLPAADRFASPEAVSRALRSLRFLAPRAEGRKIITLTTMRKARTLLAHVDLAQLAEQLSSEYFLVIKAAETEEVLRRYPATLSEFVFDAKSSLRNNEHLLATDVLLTTVFADATLFATSRRQVRLLCSPGDAQGLGPLLPARFADLTLPDLTRLPDSLALPDGAAISASFADEYAGDNDGRATDALLRELFAR